MGLDYGVSAYRSIKEACPDAILGESKGMYLSFPPENPRIFLVSLKYGVIRNERIQFATKGGEFVDLKLNCRENLTLSTSPAKLQLRSVSDEDDVGDVAVIKFDTADISLRSPRCAAVCEGLILSKYLMNPCCLSWLSQFFYCYLVIHWNKQVNNFTKTCEYLNSLLLWGSHF